MVAPSLIPQTNGDRVKTDRRDAAKLARLGAMACLKPLFNPQLNLNEYLKGVGGCDTLKFRRTLTYMPLRIDRKVHYICFIV